MVANWANLRSLLANYDMAAVRALPDAIAITREDELVLYILQEFAITLLMMLLDLSNHLKLGCNFLETFLASLSKLLRPATRASERPAVVYVTHHVEEILPAFTHVLLLRGGRAVAAGPIRSTLTPALLEKTFGAKLKVERRGGRTWLRAG